MQTWIFQGNPDRFDLDKYLEMTRHIYWSVTRKSYQNRVKVGDCVFLWRAAGKANAIPGVVALGYVEESCCPVSAVQHPERLLENLWTAPREEPTEVKAGIDVTDTRLTPPLGMLTASVIRADPVLSQMQIIRVRTGTNFPISTEQDRRLTDMWQTANDPGAEWSFEGGDYSAAEGRVLYNVHRTRERSGSLVKEAKREFLKTHGDLHCEVCRFSFKDKYGQLGDGYIEAHHTKPVQQMEPGEVSQVAGLMMVCANCHRVIHRGDPTANLAALRELLNQV